MNRQRQLRLITATLLLALTAVPAAQAQSGNSRVFGDLLKRIPRTIQRPDAGQRRRPLRQPHGPPRELARSSAKENRPDRLGTLSGRSPSSPSPWAWTSIPCTSDGRSAWLRLRRDVPLKLGDHGQPRGGLRRDGREHARGLDPPRVRPVRLPGQHRRIRLPDQPPGDRRLDPDGPRPSPQLPPGFADRAIFRADAGAQIVLAFDLADAISPKVVEPWLNAIEVIKKTKTDPTLLAPRLASVKSAFMVIKVDQWIEGNLRIDFERPVDYTGPVARELILTVLDDIGAELPEMKTWTLSFDKKTPRSR